MVVNDRVLASNTPETFAAAKPELEASLKALLGHGNFSLAPLDSDPRRRFGVLVTSAAPFDLAAFAPAKA